MVPRAFQRVCPTWSARPQNPAEYPGVPTCRKESQHPSPQAVQPSILERPAQTSPQRSSSEYPERFRKPAERSFPGLPRISLRDLPSLLSWSTHRQRKPTKFLPSAGVPPSEHCSAKEACGEVSCLRWQALASGSSKVGMIEMMFLFNHFLAVGHRRAFSAMYSSKLLKF